MNKDTSNLYYSKSHEWVRLEEDGLVTIGITDYAQQQMGDIVFVDLPTVGSELIAEGDACVIESTKSASDVYTPLSGKVVAVNEQLTDEPELVNSAPVGNGWLFQIQPEEKADFKKLMNDEAYQDYISNL